MDHILTLPNLLSLLRIPLAVLFIQGNVTMRIIAVVIAGLTDALDGFLARRYGLTSRLGTILDPLTDKLFVLTALAVLYFENMISLTEAMTLLSRDAAVVIFGGYLISKGLYGRYKIEAIWCGKIFTTLQLFVLLVLVVGVKLPVWFYGIFVVLGVLSLVELKHGLSRQSPY